MGIEWLDMVGLSLIMVGIMLAKNDIMDLHDTYGVYVYYAILGLYLLFVFGFWFS